MLTNGGGDDLQVRSQYRETLRVLKQQRGNFSDWLWGKDSNFTLVRSYCTLLKSPVLTLQQPHSDVTSYELAHAVMGFGVPLHPALASYYSNITGFVHGSLQMYNLTTYILSNNKSTPLPIDNPNAETPLSTSPEAPSWAHFADPFLSSYNTTDAIERIGSWNWSAPAELALRVLEKRPALPSPSAIVSLSKDESDVGRLNESVWKDISLMHGRVEITERDTGEELGFDFEAVHFLENGTVYGFTEPAG